MYLHSISNNNDNQDIVSMGCNAALITRKVIDNTFDVLAIQCLALMQAIDYLKCHSRLSSATHRVYDDVRSIVPAFVEDEPRYGALQQVRKYLVNLNSSLLSAS
jgi:histidine ammonia-lyase